MNKETNKYRVKDQTLQIGDSKLIFDDVINDVLETYDMLIILTLNPSGISHNQNVYGVDLKEIKIKWRIGKLNKGDDDSCPFVGIKFYENQLYLNNWCDVYLIVDPLTGTVLKKSLPGKY